MWWYKKLEKRVALLETQIKELESKTNDQQNEINKLQKLIRLQKWKAEHPAKYKVGDVVEGMMILDRTIIEPNLIGFCAAIMAAVLFGTSKEHLAEKYSMTYHWQYTVTPNGTKKIIMKESELEALKNEKVQ